MKREPTMLPLRYALLCALLCMTLTGCATFGPSATPALGKEAQQALNLAHTLRDNGRFQAAHGVYAHMDERGQLQGDYLLEYASVASMVRPAQESLALYQRARESLGDNLERLSATQRLALCSGSGRAYLALGQGALAERDFRCALQAKPDDPPALNGLGVALNLQQHSEQARTAFEQALHNSPNYGPALNNLALSWLASGDSDKAIGLLNQASGQKDIALQLNLALAYVIAGHEDIARRVLLEKLERDYAEGILEHFRAARERIQAGAPLASELLAASQHPLLLKEPD
jgi:Flp pilus assembly protein TadD